jgi:hypothetical protein
MPFSLPCSREQNDRTVPDRVVYLLGLGTKSYLGLGLGTDSGTRDGVHQVVEFFRGDKGRSCDFTRGTAE